MIENYGECRAFGLSLLLHFLLFLIAAALGLFSIAAPTGNKAPIDVVLYDAGGDTGSAGGDAAPAAAPAPAVDDIVVQDKTVQPPQEQEQQTRPMQNTAGTASAGTTLGTPGGQGTAGSGSASAGTGSGSGAGASGGDGGAGLGAASAPPRERVEASLRSEAKPEYPQELIDDGHDQDPRSSGRLCGSGQCRVLVGLPCDGSGGDCCRLALPIQSGR